MINEEKQKALEAALGHIEKQYGKGSVMKLGDSSSNMVEKRFRQALLDWILRLESVECRRDVSWRSTDRNPVVRQRLHYIW